MEKPKKKSRGEIHVTGQRARKYAIWRPNDSGEHPLEGYDPVLLDLSVYAEVRPTNGITKPIGAVDTQRAIAGLLACDTDFRFWLEAREAKFQLAKTEREWSSRLMRELRGLSMQSTRRQRRFDKSLLKWVNEYGPLDLEGNGVPDQINAIMQAVHALRSWAIQDLSLPDRVWAAAGTFWLRVDGYAREVNEAAGKCARDPETGEWKAPTLWSALCHSVQHAHDYGWRFAECEADDCFNIFLKRRTEHVTCSQRCGKRKRDHEKRDQQSQ